MSSNESEQRWVTTFVRGLDSPVTWFYDHATSEREEILRQYPPVEPTDLASITGVDFSARDGLPLHDFLTPLVRIPTRT
ncbi:hypothetical protein BJD99_00445 [Rhodococcus sp. 1163]|nr:hypothetical protein BJD99_00445 [Rhodococcus sp. 1163]